MTRQEQAEAHLAAIWANLIQLKKFGKDIDTNWLQEIADDIAALQSEIQNLFARESEVNHIAKEAV